MNLIEFVQCKGLLNIKLLLALYLRNVSQVRAVRIKIIKIYFKRGVAWMNITLSPTYVRIHRFYTSNLIWRHNGLSVFFCIYLHIKAIFMADPNGFNFKNFSLRFLVRISRPHRKPEVIILEGGRHWKGRLPRIKSLELQYNSAAVFQYSSIPV